MSAQGWLKAEPDEPFDEAPELIPKGLSMLAARRGETPSTIARQLGMTVVTLKKVTGVELSLVQRLAPEEARGKVVPIRCT